VIELAADTPELQAQAQTMMSKQFPEGYFVVWEGVDWEHHSIKNEPGGDSDGGLFERFFGSLLNGALNKLFDTDDEDEKPRDPVAEFDRKAKEDAGKTPEHHEEKPPCEHYDHGRYYICYRRQRPNDVPPRPILQGAAGVAPSNFETPVDESPGPTILQETQHSFEKSLKR